MEFEKHPEQYTTGYIQFNEDPAPKKKTKSKAQKILNKLIKLLDKYPRCRKNKKN
tara:strand:+ start:4751 stop:4915 length:165 start_codon:yes stop_codon:yes gene_type:complete